MVLSHGHYDHTGGLVSLVENTGLVSFYTHPELFKAKYVVKKVNDIENIGIPWSRQAIQGDA